jgi:hypothetical protein
LHTPLTDQNRDQFINSYDKEALYYGHNKYTRDEYHENLSQFAEACCALILVFASNVVSLQMALDFKEANQPKCPLLMSIITSQVAPLALPRLQRLRLFKDPRRNCFELPPNLPQDCMLGRRLKQIEVFEPDFLMREHFTKDAWTHVETLHIDNASLSGAWLYALCKYARPPLKDIHISISPFIRTDVYYNVLDPRAPGLDEALSFCIGTLQTLSLRFNNIRPSFEPHLGSQARFSCFPLMKVLSDLDIEPRYLFSSLDDMQSVSICDRLPRSLERLRLRETCFYLGRRGPWEGEEDQPEVDYVDLLKSALLELAFKSADRLPQLERVSLKSEKESVLKMKTFKINPEFDRGVSWMSRTSPAMFGSPGGFQYSDWELTFTPR